MYNRMLVLLAGAAFAFVLLAGCKKEPPSPQGDYYNPFDVPVDSVNIVNSVAIDENGRSEQVNRSRLSRNDFSREKFEKEPKDDEHEEKPVPKMSPVLKEWLDEKDPTEMVEILVNLREDMRLPLLPDLAEGEDRIEDQTKREAAITKIKEDRRKSQAKTIESLQRLSQFEVLDQFWLVNAISVSLTLGSVEKLLESSDVVYLQPVMGGEVPPRDADTGNDTDDGRAHILSDPYFNLSLTTPWIGLLDTGIRPTHTLFNAPNDNIALIRDCVNGGVNCIDTGDPSYDATDFAWNHGTSSAAIISGNNNLGNPYRGVTDIRLDSWQIYTAAGLNSAATIKGLEAAVALFDKVIVGELQANETETGTIATAADHAYDCGAIIVSANGNFGPGDGTVRSPAIAHKVLGVGGIFVKDKTQYNSQGRGPATDGRYKPDIQTPTFSETASNASNTALQVFGGTSGATPYASGAVMLARNWLHQFGTYDNGQTYAFMIIYGQDSYPYNNTTGAGQLRMATNGWAWWGKLIVTDGLTIDIPINISSGKDDFDAALWWPENAGSPHNDIDVHLIDPSNVERDRGFSAVSVFERAKVAGSLTAGLWKLRIRGFSVNPGGQVVYWAAHIRN